MSKQATAQRGERERVKERDRKRGRVCVCDRERKSEIEIQPRILEVDATVPHWGQMKTRKSIDNFYPSVLIKQYLRFFFIDFCPH